MGFDLYIYMPSVTDSNSSKDYFCPCNMGLYTPTKI